MKPATKFFLKLSIALFAVILAQSIWKIALPWKLYTWIAFAAAMTATFIPPIGRGLYFLGGLYGRISSEGMRFFQGFGVVLLVIAFYRLFYLVLSGSTEHLKALSPENLPVGDYRHLALAGLILLMAGSIPPLANLLFKGWMKLAQGLQFIMSRVILTVVYLVAVIPVGLTARVFGKKFLDKELNPQAESYWIDRPEIPFEPRRYRRHF